MKTFLNLLLCLLCACPLLSATDNPSRFGLDYVFPMDPQYQRKPFAKRYQEAGVTWVNFADIRWKFLEPRRPSKSRHFYDWKKLDAGVKHWQGHGFDIVMTVRTGNAWFSGPVKYTLDEAAPLIKLMIAQSDRLPKEEHLEDFELFIEAIVERYDGDGSKDMPGLERPILHYQIGNEYGNPAFWTGTVEDYYHLLRLANQAAARANRNVKIICNGLRTNDAFHNDPEGVRFEEKMKRYERQVDNDFYIDNWKRMRDLDEGTLKLTGLFSIVDAGGNGSWYTTSEGYFAYVRGILDEAGNRHIPVWDMETRNEPLLTPLINTHIHMELGIPDGKQLVGILKKPLSAKHRETQAWYRAEQARLTAKVFVTKFAAGNEKVFMGMPMDWDQGIGALSWPNPFMGFLKANAQPWPAYYTLKMLVESLDGFSSASRVESPPGVSLYRFGFPDPRKPVWVAWLDQERSPGPDEALATETVILKGITCLEAHAIPTTGDSRSNVPYEMTEQGHEVELSTTPVFFR